MTPLIRRGGKHVKLGMSAPYWIKARLRSSFFRDGNDLLGFLGFQLHPEDQMGEIHIIAVAPDRQEQGHGKRLLKFAETRIKDAGMPMVMVETVGDSGHAPARAAYEASGYQRWPVARYFKELQLRSAL